MVSTTWFLLILPLKKLAVKKHNNYFERYTSLRRSLKTESKITLESICARLQEEDTVERGMNHANYCFIKKVQFY